MLLVYTFLKKLYILGHIFKQSFCTHEHDFVNVFQVQPEEEFVRRKTQYSAETGRIVPPSTNSYQRRSHSQRLMYPQPFQDQELMVKYFSTDVYSSQLG